MPWKSATSHRATCTLQNTQYDPQMCSACGFCLEMQQKREISVMMMKDEIVENSGKSFNDFPTNLRKTWKI